MERRDEYHCRCALVRSLPVRTGTRQAAVSSLPGGWYAGSAGLDDYLPVLRLLVHGERPSGVALPWTGHGDMRSASGGVRATEQALPRPHI
jgi:hypothetical protein